MFIKTPTGRLNIMNPRRCFWRLLVEGHNCGCRRKAIDGFQGARSYDYKSESSWHEGRAQPSEDRRNRRSAVQPEGAHWMLDGGHRRGFRPGERDALRPLLYKGRAGTPCFRLCVEGYE